MSRLHAEKFRLLGQRNGERVHWLRAVESPTQGKIFVPKLLPEGVKVRIYTNYQTVQSEEFGEIKVAQTKMRFMPDEMHPLRDDRFVCLERSYNTRETLEPSTEPIRSLREAYVESISEVRGERGAYRQSRYAFDDGRLRWIGEVPDESVVVFYTYLEAYEFLGEDYKQGPLGTEGTRLPSWIPLKLLTAGE